MLWRQWQQLSCMPAAAAAVMQKHLMLLQLLAHLRRLPLQPLLWYWQLTVATAKSLWLLTGWILCTQQLFWRSLQRPRQLQPQRCRRQLQMLQQVIMPCCSCQHVILKWTAQQAGAQQAGKQPVKPSRGG